MFQKFRLPGGHLLIVSLQAAPGQDSLQPERSTFFTRRQWHAFPRSQTVWGAGHDQTHDLVEWGNPRLANLNDFIDLKQIKTTM